MDPNLVAHVRKRIDTVPKLGATPESYLVGLRSFVFKDADHVLWVAVPYRKESNGTRIIQLSFLDVISSLRTPRAHFPEFRGGTAIPV